MRACACWRTTRHNRRRYEPPWLPAKTAELPNPSTSTPSSRPKGVKPYRLTPAAQRDLSEIWDFTEERWDASQAEMYIAEIRAVIERVAADPERGRSCDEIRRSYRRYGIESHLLFFVETADSVDIVRVLQQRMDPTRHL